MSDYLPEKGTPPETPPQEKKPGPITDSGIAAIRGEHPEDAEKDVPKGEFEIYNWSGYPDGPKPEGPFRLLKKDEYKAVRDEADKANRKIHDQDPSIKDMDLHEIKPVKYGGDPTDISNKIALTRKDHLEYSKFWDRQQKEIEKHR